MPSMHLGGADMEFEVPSKHLENTEAEQNPIHVAKTNNVSARIQNPLIDLSRDELLHSADAFCEEHGFQDKRDLFRRAAILAQNPNAWRDLPELTEDDHHWIEQEHTHEWRQPRTLYYLIIVCSIGSAIHGWDVTGANGANLSFPQEFGIESNGWLIGMINSAPNMMGTFSCLLSDPVNNWIGRRGTIFFTGLFCIFPVLCQAFTHNWYELFICRAVLGLGIGMKISTIPIMTAETASATIRGALVMSFQLWVAFGIFMGFCSNLIFYRIGRIAWRIQLAAAFVPAIPLVIMIWFFYAHCQLATEVEAAIGSTYSTRVREIFTKPRLRTATLAGYIVMAGQQLCGINIISYYSSTVFSEAGFGVRDSLLVSWGFGALNVAGAFPALWSIDTFGRRNLLLIGYPTMAIFLFWAGSMFFLPDGSSASLPTLALAIYLYTIAYSPTMGPVPYVYASESFPLTHREVGMSYCVQQNFLWGTVLGLTFPSMLAAFKPYGAFYFYVGTNLACGVLTFLFVPETGKRTLEELDYIFAVPASTFAKYQCGTWFPWWIKKWVFWQRDAKLEPLYKLEGVEQ